jgi:hypothetical protein
MSKFTPGPWSLYIGPESGEPIAVCDNSSKRYTICDFRIIAHDSPIRKQSGANARLIAAAPEMYELLSAVIHLGTPVEIQTKIYQILSQIEEA